MKKIVFTSLNPANQVYITIKNIKPTGKSSGHTFGARTRAIQLGGMDEPVLKSKSNQGIVMEFHMMLEEIEELHDGE